MRAQVVPWPDDASYQLAGCIAPRFRSKWASPHVYQRWCDLRCGSAFAQLSQPGIASELVGIDSNPRALAFARIGAALSGVAQLSLHGDASDDLGRRAELVTCNMPTAPREHVARLFAAIPGLLAPRGRAVVHAAFGEIPDELVGERVIVRYADELAVLAWRPDAPERVDRRSSGTQLTHEDLA